MGWGFAAFVCGEGGYQLEHLAYGCILDDHCPVVHGPPIPLNACAGETEALLQATIWSLAHLGYYPVELYYDAISVGHGGTGQWIPGDDKHSRALGALIQYAEQFPRDLWADMLKRTLVYWVVKWQTSWPNMVEQVNKCVESRNLIWVNI